MHLKAGQKVFVKKLKVVGAITQISNTGQIMVQIGPVKALCKKDEITPINNSTIEQNNNQQNQKSSSQQNKSDLQRRYQKTSSSLEKIDLHGKKVAEALEIIEQIIDRAIIAGLDRIEVIHGLGSGKIKTALQRHLATMKIVKNFKPDLKNPGISWIYL
ncbi:MAG TPA: Smr/MutS family protein [Oligoflexia bacterium]|nr:Smr/MutS family protein [Oligoflexia bacterium]HMP27226.1 Smr/MutS family protein [Oligoflexia bacterium]